jgi:hypothetical protein
VGPDKSSPARRTQSPYGGVLSSSATFDDDSYTISPSAPRADWWPARTPPTALRALISTTWIARCAALRGRPLHTVADVPPMAGWPDPAVVPPPPDPADARGPHATPDDVARWTHEANRLSRRVEARVEAGNDLSDPELHRLLMDTHATRGDVARLDGWELAPVTNRLRRAWQVILPGVLAFAMAIKVAVTFAPQTATGILKPAAAPARPPSTTGQVPPITTGQVPPITTGQVPPITTVTSVLTLDDGRGAGRGFDDSPPGPTATTNPPDPLLDVEVDVEPPTPPSP